MRVNFGVRASSVVGFSFSVSFWAMLSMSAFSTSAGSVFATAEQVTLTAVVLNLQKLRGFELLVQYS